MTCQVRRKIDKDVNKCQLPLKGLPRHAAWLGNNTDTLTRKVLATHTVMHRRSCTFGGLFKYKVAPVLALQAVLRCITRVTRVCCIGQVVWQTDRCATACSPLTLMPADSLCTPCARGPDPGAPRRRPRRPLPGGG